MTGAPLAHRLDAVKAVLFDVDGTLYHQTPVRALMAAELALAACSLRSPNPGLRAVKTLAAFRRAGEALRSLGMATEPVDRLQCVTASERAHEPLEFVQRTVDEWMFTRPLKYLHAARRRRVVRLAIELARAGIKVGVLSDYPVREKASALGLSDLLSLQLCTTDPEINALKPHPRGFLFACDRWGLSPAEVAYVGDRADVDAAGAHAAGMACFLVDSRPLSVTRKDLHDVPGSVEELHRFYRATA